jgi:maleate isomerase
MADAQGFTARLGVITPSGNVVVERVTAAVLAGTPTVSAHYARIAVRGSVDPFPDSDDMEGMLTAARLLADARPDIIFWNGSKGAAIGLGHDRALAAAITAETGIPATTSIIVLHDLLIATGAKRVGLATPFRPPYQERLPAELARWGVATVAASHAGLSDNLSYASVPPERILAQIDEAAAVRPDAVLTVCTNYAAAFVAAEAERRTGVAVYDTTLLPIWHALTVAGHDTAPLASRWGSLFSR